MLLWGGDTPQDHDVGRGGAPACLRERHLKMTGGGGGGGLGVGTAPSPHYNPKYDACPSSRTPKTKGLWHSVEAILPTCSLRVNEQRIQMLCPNPKSDLGK